MEPKQKQSLNMLSVFSLIFLGILIICMIYLVWQMLSIGFFSATQLIMGAGILALLLVLFIFLLLKKYEHSWVKLFLLALTGCIALVCGFGGYYLQKTGDFLNAIAGKETLDSKEKDSSESEILNEADVLSNKIAMTVTTYAMQETEIIKPTQLNNMTVGVITKADEKGTEGAIKQLSSKGTRNAEYVEYENAFVLVDALYDGLVDAIILPEQFHEDLLNAANDINKYNALTTFTNTVDQYIYYEPIPDEMKNPADPVKDITKDPFTILISGSDSYGNLSVTSRSDVNMLVTVNPVTYQVLIVSLPRDSYVPFSCKKNEYACINVSGLSDKLTHSGLYGIGTTESTIEDYLDIEINYTVRVNFSSLINIVDSINGIDVEVEPGLEVETFYANGTEGVKAGWNHLNGERALAFARERHAYLNGDNQRIINQQIVLKALLKKMMSPTMVVNYPSFIKALSTAFFTNMPASQIKALIGLEVSNFPSWDIQMFAINGEGGSEYCPSLNSYASVVYPNSYEVEKATYLIEEALKGMPFEEETDSQISSQSSEKSSKKHWYDDDYTPALNNQESSNDQTTYPTYNDDPYGYREPLEPFDQSYNDLYQDVEDPYFVPMED